MNPPEILTLPDGSKANLLDQIGGQGANDAIYRDNAGRFYHLRGTYNRLPAEEAEITLPGDGEKFRQLRGEKEELRQISERTALALYVREWMNEGPLKELMKECVAGFVPSVERGGKTRLETWVPRALAKNLKAFARSHGRDPDAQLELFARDGLTQRKAEKPQRSAKAAHGPAIVQLELATALVACCARLTCQPTTETLAEARRNVSILHRDLHADETFKAVANG